MKSDEQENCVVRIWMKIEISPTDSEPEHQAEQDVPRSRGRPSKMAKDAEKWLEKYLIDGPKYAGNKNNPAPGSVFGDSLAAGFKSNVIWRAAEKLGVTKRQEPKTRRWVWTLPWQENIAYAVRD